MALILLPDVNGFFQDDNIGWPVYDTCMQLRNAAFCLMVYLFHRSPGIWIALKASAAWYVGQAIDEAFYGNEFHDGIWEYPALALLIGITYIIIKRNDRSRQQGP